MENPIRLPAITLFQKDDGNVGIDILWDEKTVKECARLIVNLLDGRYNASIVTSLAKDSELVMMVKELVAQQQLANHLRENQAGDYVEQPLVSSTDLWARLSGQDIGDDEHDPDCPFHDHDHDCDDDE